MKLLVQLKPPKMPTPITYSDWLSRNLEGVDCDECFNERSIECPECYGYRATDCPCCGNEKDCDDCDGLGSIPCECAKDLSENDYIKCIANDYYNLFYLNRFVMPKDEILKIAKTAARHCQT